MSFSASLIVLLVVVVSVNSQLAPSLPSVIDQVDTTFSGTWDVGGQTMPINGFFQYEKSSVTLHSNFSVASLVISLWSSFSGPTYYYYALVEGGDCQPTVIPSNEVVCSKWTSSGKEWTQVCTLDTMDKVTSTVTLTQSGSDYLIQKIDTLNEGATQTSRMVMDLVTYTPSKSPSNDPSFAPPSNCTSVVSSN
eukprot:TRINITY_DN4328_c0_g1_i1.p1 TRINITY_DN4328_c0_g1~~TRINITY_DN4328_c0_g1_i1.p1  ORF type:complete len:193 (+),score=48.23 TRINITY_DN4328_c0_g1_i1:13-591(+)